MSMVGLPLVAKSSPNSRFPSKTTPVTSAQVPPADRLFPLSFIYNFTVPLNEEEMAALTVYFPLGRSFTS